MLLSVVTCLGIGWFVFLQNRHRLLNALWGTTNFFVAWWGLGNFLLLESSTPSHAIFWARAAIFGAALIPAFWLHFAYQLTETPLNIRVLFIIYLAAIINAALSWHPLLITGVAPRPGFHFYPEAGPFYILHCFLFYSLILPGLFQLGRAIVKTKGYKKKRLAVIFFASFISLFSGFTHHLSSYNEKIIPIGSQFMFLYPIIITIAMYRYHIFGIHLADKSPSYYERVKLASDRMAKETELRRLKETILEIIHSQVHPSFCRIYFANDSAPFSDWFSRSKEPILREKIEAESRELYQRMASLDAELCVPAFHQEQLMGVILLGEKRAGVYSAKDLSFLMTLANDAATAIRNAQLITQLQQTLSGIIDAFAAAVGKMDPDYTHEHILRTKGIAGRIVQRLKERGIPLGIPEELFLAGILLHDVGKLFTPREILHKNGPLTEEEWLVMKKHPADGAEILGRIQGLEELAKIAHYHQERWDGRGYPAGLKGDEIPLGAQVAAVADAFDAMISDRPYRKGMSRVEAIGELKRNAGTQFSPLIVQLMVELYQEDINESFPLLIQQNR